MNSIRQKLIGILLIGTVALLGVTPVLAQKVYSTLAEYEKLTGKTIEKFNEAPALRIRVAAGELPSVEERISEEPLVVEPLEEIGQYGGILKSGTLGIHSGGPDPRSTRMQAWLAVDPISGAVIPNVAKAWDLSKDMKTLTLYLRKGMKWSDGVPFTAGDVMFWYEDIVLNKEITPVVETQWCPGEKPVKVQKVDDYTVQFEFVVPYPAIMGLLAADYNDVGLHYPKHYLEKYHIKYNPRANEIAKEEGYDFWWQCFNVHRAIVEPDQDPNRPDINPWVLKKITVKGDKHFGRNPYYWKVDTEGNQLPYIEEMYRIVTKSTEIMDLKLMSGELNYGGCKLSFEDYPLYKQGEKKGNYRALLLDGDVRNNQGMSFNLWHKDPVLRKIFNDVRFRQALSLAMNREKVNEVLYLGMAKPWQATVGPRCSFFEDWMGKYYTEYDLKKANSLLDEMGLNWDKNHKYRLRPDGKPLVINLQYVDLGSGWKQRLEIKRRDWEEIGVKVVVKEIDRSLYITLLNALELDFAIWNYEAEESDLRYSKSYLLHGVYWSSPWSLWHLSKGEAGEEPPDEVKTLYRLIEEWTISLPETDEYRKLGKEVLTIHAKNLWALGDLCTGPQPVVFANNLRNTPDKGPFIWPGQRFWKLYQPDQWFFKK